MRKRAAGVAFALAAFATATAVGDRAPTNPPAARAAAERILGTLRLPPGATESRTDPSYSKLAKPAIKPATPDLVDLHSFWRVPGDPQRVFNWITGHPPAGAKAFEQGGEGVNGSPVSQYVGFSFLMPRRGGAPSETLLMTVVAARGGGTAVRADAQVVWLFRRPASERIPAGTHAIVVTERRPTGRHSGPWTVTDRRRVRRIVSMVDRLPAAQPGPVACPADLGPIVTLNFESAASAAHRLARAVADGGGCGFVALWIRGHRQPVLRGGSGLIKRLGALLGTRLS